MLYRTVIRSCGTVAAVGAVVYCTISVAAAVDGPDSSLNIPHRLNILILTALILAVIVSTSGWLIRTANRHSATTDIRRVVAAELETALEAAGEKLAAAVTHDVAGLLEQRLHKVAEKTAKDATARTVAAVTAIAGAERDIILSDLDSRIESWLKRTQTMWMIAETNGRTGNGTVASINSRRDT